MIQDERVLVRRKATKVKTLTGPSFTTRRTTFNPLYIKYDHFVRTSWSNIYVSCILGGKNRLNKNPTPQACLASGADTAKVGALQPASSSGLHQHSCSRHKEDPCVTPPGPQPPHPRGPLRSLTFSGSSLCSPRCFCQDPSCGGEEARASGCCF